VFADVHLLKRRVEQSLLLIPRQPAVSAGLQLLVHPHAEAVERRLLEHRRRLRHAPVHRRAEQLECAVHGRDLDLLGVV
jgi:hypothetical protein